MTERSVFFLPTNEFIFMVHDADDRWIPHLPTMAAWRAGRIRIYRPPPLPPSTVSQTIITMPGHVRWPIMTPQEAEEIHAVVQPPWIPVSAAYDTVPESAIDDLDPVIARGDIEELARPALLWEQPLELVLVPPPAPPPSAPPPSAPPAPPPPQTSSLPPHVAAILIAHAVATAAICPISLTPIDAATAVATPCGHVFDGDALRSWLSRQRVCPECRAQI